MLYTDYLLACQTDFQCADGVNALHKVTESEPKKIIK